jgi:hypothetical protein
MLVCADEGCAPITTIATSNTLAAQLRQQALMRAIMAAPHPRAHGINKASHRNDYCGLKRPFLIDVADLARDLRLGT